MRKKAKIFAFVVLSIMAISGLMASLFYQSNRVVIKAPFPNPFMFEDGTIVETSADWDMRREEIKELLMSIEYGHMPSRPDALEVYLKTSEPRGDGSLHQILEFKVIPSNNSASEYFNFTLDLYIPPGTGPFPAIIKVSPDGTGTQIENNQTITSKGFIYACYHHEDLDPDRASGGNDVIGAAQAAYPSCDWGSLMVWAWGGMRVADYLLQEVWASSDCGFPSIDPSSLIITGHSRRGKTALVAGAFDERFSMVACNGGCAGGAASYLVLGPGAETLGSITKKDNYFYWFHQDFGEYANREHDLPFDQHFLRALVAPRIMMTTDGSDDSWANPIGVQAVYEASQPVFDFLDAPENNTIHYRSGGHGFLKEDFNSILGFADKILLGNASVIGEFYMTPYDIDFPIEYSSPV